ncbi:ProQ/FINO family protein [Polaromonas sp. CG_9.11]|uniref:ProQ/FINO family protein n=1 Tax=Polaromonas sp. CG_9.11 TaxID=2787730 RepID=UPI0018CBCD9F|nr:ProQ/FINO family protein [Polaromonas sp. CG_9.11]MBG6074744.1 sRNA-binding protein [Polaromonas sp. CG_9.11]
MTDTVTNPELESTPAVAPAPQRPARQGGRGRTPAKQQNQARAPRAVHPVLQQLFDLYPKMFGAQFLPLKLGVFQDLLALHPDLFKRDELKVALGLHARSTRYLESVASGLQRHDLNGEPVEPVAPEHVHHAIMEVFRRRQARSNQDLRPYARAQLIEAIEASGLSRESYRLCIRQQDEVSTSLLDDVFAELAEQSAKRDALLRMFEASGKTVAEFSDMYGMEPDEVRRTVEWARADQAAHAVALAKAQEVPVTAEAEAESETETETEVEVEAMPKASPEESTAKAGTAP